MATCKWCGIESQTDEVCSWCKRPLDSAPGGGVGRAELHFLGEAAERTNVRDIVIGVVVSAAVMGLVLYLGLRPRTPAGGAKVVQTRLSAERAEAPVTASYTPPRPPRTRPDEFPGVNEPAGGAAADPYEPPPVVRRPDGREPVSSQPTQVVLDPETKVKLKAGTPLAYLESADIVITREGLDANVTATVVVVNQGDRPLDKIEVQLEVAGLRTKLKLHEDSPTRTPPPAAGFGEYVFTAKTLLNDRALAGKKRLLLDAWVPGKKESVKDSLVVEPPKSPSKAKTSG